jgi:hypothetical protein
MAQGQAAGTAAALAARKNVNPREVDIHELQELLIADGCEVGQGLK